MSNQSECNGLDLVQAWMAGSFSECESRKALSEESLGFGFTELLAVIQHSGQELQKMGLFSAHRVAVVIEERWSMSIASISVMSHAVCVPMNHEYTADEWRYYLERLRVDVVLTSAQENLGVCEVAVELGLPQIKVNLADESKKVEWEGELRESGSDIKPASPMNHDDREILVLHTSGSTADPKVVPLTYKNIVASARNLSHSLHLKPSDICLNMMPLYHVGGILDLLLFPLVAGSQVILVPEISTRCFFKHFSQFQPTWIQLVPAMLQDIVIQIENGVERVDGHRLRFIRSVSSPLSEEWRERAEKVFGVPIVEIYGMTETAGVITSQSLETRLQRKGSVGVAVGSEVVVVDEMGNRVKSGRAGEVLVRGAQVMRGYETALGVSKEAFQADWMHTGDLGEMDEEGNLFLTGRIKEMINRGGEKISPLEIDRALESFAGVSEAASFSKPHPSLGEEVVAAVVPDAGISIDQQQLLLHVTEKLAAFKVPKKIYFTEALPRNRGGKLRRHKLIELLDEVESACQDDVCSETQSQLREIWKQSLQVKKLTLQDNFFELGGDSLKAATLCAAIEHEFQVPIDVTALFDHQTIESFSNYLDGICQGQTDAGSLARTALGDDLYSELKAFSLAWKGERRTSDSLVVGLNTLGDKQPLFWCAQSNGELECVAGQLKEHRPVYGMRSLYRVSVRSEEYNVKVARYYADEISKIQPEGGIMLGGFCEGGKIACEIARLLTASGRKVDILLLQEYFEAQPIPCDVVYFSSEKTLRGPRFFYARPELGFGKFCQSKVAWIKSPWAHDDYYVEPFLREGVDQLKAAMAGEVDWLNVVPMVAGTIPNFRLSALVPRYWFPGQKCDVRVTIQNNAPEDWQPTDVNGLTVGSRWLTREGIQKGEVGESVKFQQELNSADTYEMVLKVKAPTRKSRRMLEISIVEEGVAWIDQPSSPSIKFLINVLPAARWLQKLPAKVSSAKTI